MTMASHAASPAIAADEDELFGPIAAIDRALVGCCSSPSAPVALTQAIRYALLGGGKRLRPLLAWHCAAAVGADPERSLPAGCALELVHAFSLVHDDLPAIDNDDLRRGLPTLHKHAGEAMALLAGDAMLAHAFEILAYADFAGTSGATPKVRDDSLGAMGLRLALVRELSTATSAMIHGQIWDTLGGLPAGLSRVDQLRLIHTNKTGALIRAACRMGAIAGLGDSSCGPQDASALEPPALVAITRYADAVGLMFQIVDDLMDVEQTAEHTGKRTGKDQEAGKLTYPAVLGIAASKSEITRLLGLALDAITPLGPNARSLQAMAQYLAGRTR